MSHADIAGIWESEIEAQGQKLGIYLKVQKQATGYSATLDSPDQGAMNLPLDELTYEDDKVKFASTLLNLTFTGRLNEKGNIKGKLKQHGQTFRLSFTPAKTVTAERPQTPQPPYPFAIEDISMKLSGGLVLTGSITVPDNPTGALIFVSGSSQHDLDSTIAGHKPFLVMADYFSRRGYVTFRYNDRGISGSTGDVVSATTDTFAADIEPAVGYLANRFGVPVGIVGHSEGSSIGSITALRADVAFLIMLGAPVFNGRDILAHQNVALLTELGRTQRDIDLRLTILNRVHDYIVAGDEAGAVVYLRDTYKSLRKKRMVELGFPRKWENYIAVVTSPWTRHFLADDPTERLRALQIPILGVFGGKDLQVVAEYNAPKLQTLLQHGYSRVEVFPQLNHLMQAADTGLPGEYFLIEETVNPGLLEVMGDWLDGLLVVEQQEQ